jgi:hypothetical protein
VEKMMKIIVHRKGREREVEGTLAELTKYFGYTLEKGKSWEHEKGNKKISLKPRNLESLVKNLNNAEDNAAANGCGSTYYTIGGEQDA